MSNPTQKADADTEAAISEAMAAASIDDEVFALGSADEEADADPDTEAADEIPPPTTSTFKPVAVGAVEEALSVTETATEAASNEDEVDEAYTVTVVVVVTTLGVE
ncbi:hypothetical protein NLJ89_g10925 [Agrocybe chaxingu]|uniref:Uncharacterized protein n=1 Tax=Agrocybe chaxingu TaxID=84603 RepID=A0A9W8JQB5_9AGAR|nr:hypothetical protein NLJ89_g10925 [Agrocybe chaxingu]